MQVKAPISPKHLLCTGALLTAILASQPTLAEPVRARSTLDFLNSIGINTTTPDRGQPLNQTIGMLRFGGWRWVRAGIEGMSERGPTTIQTFLDLHQQTGVKFSWGLGSGLNDLNRLMETGKILAKAGALIAFEGSNEPNNWPITYQGETGGRGATSWMPVAKLQRDLYALVKGTPELAGYPVWSPSEVGAQWDDVGLQFLIVPPAAGTLMPPGTKFADAANLHNYFYHSNASAPADNKTWDAADPSSANRVDGLYANFGKTWGKGYRGYSEQELQTLPRVTTETGVPVGGAVTERLHAVHLTNLYLAQFKRGFSFTAPYILRDRTDEGGNQGFGYFRADYSPRPAALFLHNMTTILADTTQPSALGSLDYKIDPQPKTVHDLLLQGSDGGFRLVVWGEKLSGESAVTVKFDRPYRVSISDPTIGAVPIETKDATTNINLSLSDHPVILTLTEP